MRRNGRNGRCHYVDCLEDLLDLVGGKSSDLLSSEQILRRELLCQRQ